LEVPYSNFEEQKIAKEYSLLLTLSATVAG